MNLFLESLIVGLSVGIFGLIISTLLMFAFSRDFSLSNYTFWPQVFFGYFLTGMIIHLFYEFTGQNKKFCCERSYICP